MSISEPEKRSPPLSVPGQTVPAGLPEPDVLARMANEFFTALPDFIPVAESVLNEAQRGTSVPSAHLAGVPVNTAFVPTADIPSDTQLRALPTTSMFPAVHPQIPAIPGTAIPEVPGGVTETRYGGISSLSFLDEIRPIFSYPKGTPLPLTPQAATVTIPGATELQALVNSFSSYATPEVTESVPAQSAPQLPGTSFPRETTDFSTGYSFLNEIRQLAPAGTLAGADPSHTHTATAPGLNLSSQPFDVQAIRRDFPILQERVHGKPLIWLDNAATTQKPQSVIDRLSHFYQRENSNIHRAAHELAARATDAYESAREKVRRFINAPTVREIIFVRGATEGVNLVAQSWGRQHIQKDDEIVITWLEHHANIVPWQMLCAEKGAKLRVVPVDNTGQVLLDEYQRLLGQKTRLVAFAQVSNALGTVTPAHEMIEMAHRYGAKVLLDGAQAGLAHADRRAGLRLRLLRVLRPQDVRADGNRRRIREDRRTRKLTAVARRRQHDPGCHLRKDDLPAATRPLRGRHRKHRRCRRLGRGHRLPRARGHGEHLSLRTRFAALCHGIASDKFPACA